MAFYGFICTETMSVLKHYVIMMWKSVSNIYSMLHLTTLRLQRTIIFVLITLLIMFLINKFVVWAVK